MACAVAVWVLGVRWWPGSGGVPTRCVPVRVLAGPPWVWGFPAWLAAWVAAVSVEVALLPPWLWRVWRLHPSVGVGLGHVDVVV